MTNTQATGTYTYLGFANFSPFAYYISELRKMLPSFMHFSVVSEFWETLKT
jgi:hypothetical protein